MNAGQQTWKQHPGTDWAKLKMIIVNITTESLLIYLCFVCVGLSWSPASRWTPGSTGHPGHSLRNMCRPPESPSQHWLPLSPRTDCLTAGASPTNTHDYYMFYDRPNNMAHFTHLRWYIKINYHGGFLLLWNILYGMGCLLIWFQVVVLFMRLAGLVPAYLS